MTGKLTFRTALIFLSSWFWSQPPHAVAQERIKIAYSSADASNFVWYAAVDKSISFSFRARPPPFRALLPGIFSWRTTPVGRLRTLPSVVRASS